MEFTKKESEALNKPADKLLYDDHAVLLSALEKLVQTGDKNNISACAIRVAMSLDRSRIPHHEKAYHWGVAATKAKEAGSPCSNLYEVAGGLLGRDMDHYNSAKLYELAADEAIVEGLSTDNVKKLFQLCRRQYELAGDSEKASDTFIKENNYKLQSSVGITKGFLYLYRALSSYGESPLRVLFFALLVICSCAVVYFATGIYSSLEAKVIHSISTSLYFSVVTFTTLGYGDYSPANSVARLVASVQAVSGMLLTSLFLVTVVRKYSR